MLCWPAWRNCAGSCGSFDRVSVGFPGVVKHGCTYGAFNLHPLWAGGFPLQAELEKRWRKPVRVGNDADVAGYGAIKGEGVELVLTLGTGLGGRSSPTATSAPASRSATIPGARRHDLRGLHRPPRPGQVRQEGAGTSCCRRPSPQTEKLFNWDHLYLGGGNTKKINFTLPKNVSIVSNESGLLGGVYLWRDQG